MTSDKARQFGNDLCCLAASIAEIGEELKALYDFDGPDHEEAVTGPRETQKAPSLEEIRAVLAEKSRDGHTAAVRGLLEQHGAPRLSEIDPAKYAALLAEAEALGDG